MTKFKVGDTVLITIGKDKGKQAKVKKVIPERNAVVVEGMNLYVKHVKPFGGRSGEKQIKERPLSMGKVAIWNEVTKKADRVGFSVAKDGSKVRVFKKTGKPITVS